MDSAASRKCFKCGKDGHLRKDCPNKRKSEFHNAKCYLCGRHGHYQKECPAASEVACKTKSSTAQKSFRKKPPSDISCIDSTKTFIDTHCHVEYVYERFKHCGSFKEFQNKVAFPGCFEGCITTFCDPAAFSSFGLWKEILAEDNIWGTFGCHPHNAKYYNENLEAKILHCMDHPKAIALGEIGLDYSNHSPSPPMKQKDIFAKMCRWAVRLQKPIIVHCRNAEEDTYEILQNCVPHDWKIHLHCHSGSAQFTPKFLQSFTNIYVGFTGLVTFAKAKNIHELAFDWPLEKLLIETDSPYHVPAQVSNDFQWSHTGLAIYVAERLAEKVVQ